MISRPFFLTLFFFLVFQFAIGMNEGFCYERVAVLRYFTPQPYSPVPLYPGETPVGYYLNRPLYDYNSNIGVFQNSIINPYSLLPNVHNRVYHPSRQIADFNGDGASDEVKPHYVKVYPHKPIQEEYSAEKQPRATRTWKTNSGEVFENAFIVGIVDGRLVLKTPDGSWFYVGVKDLDTDSTKALDEWRQHRIVPDPSVSAG